MEQSNTDNKDSDDSVLQRVYFRSHVGFWMRKEADGSGAVRKMVRRWRVRKGKSACFVGWNPVWNCKLSG